MTDSTTQPMSEEQSNAWVRQQWQQANKYLAENGVIADTLDQNVSRYLVPALALWRITGADGKSYWVINGELPADFILADHAVDAREALRYFSLKWQMQSANIADNEESTDEQKTRAGLLENRAEFLYRFYEDDTLWMNS